MQRPSDYPDPRMESVLAKFICLYCPPGFARFLIEGTRFFGDSTDGRHHPVRVHLKGSPDSRTPTPSDFGQISLAVTVRVSAFALLLEFLFEPDMGLGTIPCCLIELYRVSPASLRNKYYLGAILCEGNFLQLGY